MVDGGSQLVGVTDTAGHALGQVEAAVAVDPLVMQDFPESTSKALSALLHTNRLIGLLQVNLWRRGFDVAADHGDLRAGLALELVAAQMHHLFAAALRSWSLGHHDDDLLRADTDFAIGLVVVSVVAEPRRSEWIDRMADAQARVVVASRRALVDQRVSEDSSARL